MNKKLSQKCHSFGRLRTGSERKEPLALSEVEGEGSGWQK